MTTPTAPDLAGAADAVALAQHLVDQACAAVRERGGIDPNQVVAYDVAHAAAAVASARATLEYGALGDVEARIASAFVADVVADLVGARGRPRIALGRGARLGRRRRPTSWRHNAIRRCWPTWPPPRARATWARTSSWCARRSTASPRTRCGRTPSTCTARTCDIPEEVIEGLAELGGFGLSVPEEYDGFASGGESDYMGMVVATEELSWGSLGVGGSLITRPEILTRALVYGGTEEQKKQWLPKLASAEILAAVAVTEPDFGSDVAGIVTAATPVEGGWVINGVKTWCTFAARADVLMLLARTDPDRSLAHRGISMFVVEKPRGDGHGFVFTQEQERRTARPTCRPAAWRGDRSTRSATGACTPTSWPSRTGSSPRPTSSVAATGLGKGFYLQMQGFENGRLQTAARALGIMQAAYEAALAYAAERKVFGSPIGEYQLTRYKLGRMAVIIQATRQSSYHVARLMARGEGTLEASMVKAYVCRAAEWVTREAMQIHGGMGYAEEFAVSRYFVDARVLSIFEGADETLALKVIARRLIG